VDAALAVEAVAAIDMKRLCTMLLLPVLAAGWLVAFASADAASPFAVTSQLDAGTLRVAFQIPAHHHLYADTISFELDGQPATFVMPAAVTIADKFSGGNRQAYEKSFEATLPLASPASSLIVRYQGCDEANCYFPQTETFSLTASRNFSTTSEQSTPAADGEWRALAGQFTVAARGTGYLNEREFLSFLDQSKPASVAVAGQSASPLGVVATLGLILLGGLGLNLTPCILPLVPINLAIIGAGAQASSRRRGFLLGGTYAAGMAIAYGVLGAVVVLTGSKFGTLNSSPWFNVTIAGIFVVLALAMFDVFTIDLSRFQTGQLAGQSKFVLAYTMGSVAALLAGACVAPVVISVLLQATTLYNRGLAVGLALPLLLGVGMGLPWPFAGAGLSFLPKPGKWMSRVKYAFGVIIALFAMYYGYLAFGLFHPGNAEACATSTGDLRAALDQARAQGKPVFIDFWASWCKNCEAMEHTTFRSTAVQQRLGDFVFVRLQAERPNESPARELLDYFGAIGLPTYIVLTPQPREETSS